MHDTFNQILLLMATAVAVSIFFRRLQLPSVLAYMLVGLFLGPFMLNWLELNDTIIFVSELGLVFLLFSLGLEFSIPRMIALRRLVLLLGGLQVLISTFIISLVLIVFGVDAKVAFIVAGALSMSSTAIVTKELNTSKSLHTNHGQAIISVLIFQDLAAVVFLIAVPVLSGGKNIDFFSLSLAYDLLKGLVLFTIMLTVGKWLIPKMFLLIGKTQSEEVFSLSVLFLALSAGAITHAVGLSMELGAFIAGMLLAESRYLHQIESNIKPFRDILLGLFFIYVGMLINPSVVLEYWYWVVLGLFGLLFGKASLIYALAKWLNKQTSSALRIGIYLAQGGEFGFALLALGVKHNSIGDNVAALVVAIIVTSMALTPVLVKFAEKLAKNLDGEVKDNLTTEDEIHEQLPDLNLSEHVIICGFGRVGQTVHRFLQQENIPHIAVDKDADRVNIAAAIGEPVVKGNPKSKEVLKSLSLASAKLLIITVDNVETSKKIIEAARTISQTIPIIVRTRDETGIDKIKEAGATDIVPEVLEGGLTLVSHALLTVGVPFHQVTHTLRKARMEKYEVLRKYVYGDKSNEEDLTMEQQRMQAVYLTENAWALGKELADLKLKDLNVKAVSLKREENEEIPNPSCDIVLNEGDLLVICGTSSQVDEAEHRLLAGFRE